MLQAANKLHKLDGLDPIADGYENIDVRIIGEEGHAELSFPMKDVQKSMASIYDANTKELGKIAEAMRLGQGAEFFHLAVVPGVDYFELKLSPW